MHPLYRAVCGRGRDWRAALCARSLCGRELVDATASGCAGGGDDTERVCGPRAVDGVRRGRKRAQLERGNAPLGRLADVGRLASERACATQSSRLMRPLKYISWL